MLHYRAPEEYPENLGLARPDILRTDLDKLAILRQADACYERHGCVRLLTSWGIGWKPAVLESDRLAAAHLGLIAATLQNTLRRGTRLTLLLGDNHARANEVPEATIHAYARSVQALAAEFGFGTVMLSDVFPLAPAVLDAAELTAEEQAMYAPEQVHYEKSARHLHAEHAERRARRYFLVRWRERQAVADAFPDSIFASHEILQRLVLDPPLPAFHIHLLPFPRLRKLKPWFLKNF